MRLSPRATLWGLLGVALVAGTLASAGPGTPHVTGRATSEPDIVMVQLDDASLDLVSTMSELQDLVRDSATFENAFVADSLCCSSRAVTFTGQYPHNTGVRVNYTGPDPERPVGGYAAFAKYGNLERSFNVALNRRAPTPYVTAMSGKYLNAYRPGAAPPPGWSVFEAVLADGYQQYDYTMTRIVRGDDGRRRLTTTSYGDRPQDYGTTVQTGRALDFIREHRDADRPYYLQLSTYAPHVRTAPGAHPDDPRFVPAPQDAASAVRPDGSCGPVACSSLDVADLPGYADPSADNAPLLADGTRRPWRADRTLGPRAQRALNTRLRDRARMVQSVDRMIGEVRRAIGRDAYLVVTSDNGYRLGQFSMPNGKATPYDADIRVLLVVHGPGVAPGPREQIVSNLDLASTFEEIAGVAPSLFRDGRSFLDALRDPDARGARVAFVEHQRTDAPRNDPDRESSTRLVPSYVAARTEDALLVRYDLDPGPGVLRGWEFYRGLSRPGAFEQTNTYDPDDATVRWLTERLAAFDGCRGTTCRSAAR